MRRRLIFLPLAVLLVAAISAIAIRFHIPTRQRSITMYSIGAMVDPKVLDNFSEDTGIAVRYVRLDQGVAYPLSQCDLLLTELPFLEMLDAQGRLTPLDAERVVTDLHYAPSYFNAVRRNTHTAALPALWTTMGLIHDSTASGAMVGSWSKLFDPDYPGTIALTGSDTKALACALLALGWPIDSPRPEQCLSAVLALNRLSAVTLDYNAIGSLRQGFADGKVTLAPCYAGQAVSLMSEMPQLSFVTPIEGTWQTVLAYTIPRGCVDEDAAYALLNYLNRPYIMARNAVYSGWSTPSLDAWRLLSASWQKNPLAYGRSGLAVMHNPPMLDLNIGKNVRLPPL